MMYVRLILKFPVNGIKNNRKNLILYKLDGTKKSAMCL